MGLFLSFDCKYCGKPLPTAVHYKNMGMVRVDCTYCGRVTYINKLKTVKAPND